ncbi:hypothetical protein TNCV_2168011 [Trichonephila clavipes]|nr:hypothetical protein TNCV_2168011 [Trichonephila clavipes]
MQVTAPFFSFPPQIRGRKPWGGQGPSSSLTLPPTTREDLQLDGYLEYPLPQRHHTFTSIHVFSGIQIQFQQHRSQRR